MKVTGTSATEIEKWHRLAQQGFEGRGIAIHEIQAPGVDTSLLGVRQICDPPMVCQRRDRIAKLEGAISFVLDVCGRATAF